ncbi:MAG: LysR family transcriptional regulator [Rhizobiales bacterium]|nr:LysR family transcriptional regulator [Hyphomicrobiales bacterium]
MTLEQLRIFVAVSERRHMTWAAKDLRITQSGVSAAISALEARCGIPLFDRIGRQIRLTDAGEILLKEARHILARVDAAALALEEIGDARRGTLRIHASRTVASYWLPVRIATYRKEYPRVRVELKIDNTANVARAVVEGAASIGLVEGSIEDPVLHSKVVAMDELVVVAKRSRSRGRKITPEDLKKLPWVLREQGSGTRSALESALAGFGLSASALNVVLEIPSNEAIRSMVEAGAGATALSSLVVKDSVAAGRIVRLPIRLPKRAFTLLYHRQAYVSRIARNFIELLNRGAPRTPV